MFETFRRNFNSPLYVVSRLLFVFSNLHHHTWNNQMRTILHCKCTTTSEVCSIHHNATVSLTPRWLNSRRSSWLKGTKPHRNTWLGSVWPATARRVASAARGWARRGGNRGKVTGVEKEGNKREMGEREERESSGSRPLQPYLMKHREKKRISNTVSPKQLLFRGYGALTAGDTAPNLHSGWQLHIPSPPSLPSSLPSSFFESPAPAVAIMGDSCGLSILLDCQPLGQGRNFSRSPWDHLHPLRVTLTVHVPELKEREQGPFTCCPAHTQI